MKKLIIRNGNISIGGQEKMLIEFLHLLAPKKYKVLLLIEENNGYRNDYINEIPQWVDYKFLVPEKFMMNIEKNQKSKNPLRKLFFSYLLKKKKKISIRNFKKNLDFSDIIIDYDMGLLRNLNELDLKNKTLVGWSHAGSGEKIKNKQKRKNIELYNYIVSINEEMKKGHERNTSHPKIVKIHNFMDFDKIIGKSKELVEEKFRDYILTIGSLTENKNQGLLIDAFSELKNEGKVKEKLVIIGIGKEKENLEKKIKELNMENEIYLLGQKSNPYKYIKGCKLYVTTSRNESFSLTTLEAMVLGKMVISTKTNGTIEILGSNSEYGKLVENNSFEELKNEINFYLENLKAREIYETKSLERANDFSKEKIKKEIEDFLDKL